MTYTLDEVIEMAERTDKLIERSEFHKDATEYLKQYREMRWHYPSRGELPTEQNYYFVAVKPAFEGADMIVSLYTYFPREEKWIDKWGYSIREVYAWMPVPEPPKEEA